MGRFNKIALSVVMLIIMTFSTYAWDYPMYRPLSPADSIYDVTLFGLNSTTDGFADMSDGGDYPEQLYEGVAGVRIIDGPFTDSHMSYVYSTRYVTSYDAGNDNYTDVIDMTSICSADDCGVGFWSHMNDTSYSFMRIQDDVNSEGYLYIGKNSGGIEYYITGPTLTLDCLIFLDWISLKGDIHVFTYFDRNDSITLYINGTYNHSIDDTNTAIECDGGNADLSDLFDEILFPVGVTEFRFGIVGDKFGMMDVAFFDGLTDHPTFILEEPVSNTGPVIDDPCLDTTILHTENLFCEINASDVDLDPLTFYVNDSRVTITGNNISDNPALSDYNIPDGWTIAVNVTDGLEWANFTFVYRITDSTPVITDICPFINISHAEYLNCDVNATDPESDPLYFYVNDSRVTMNVSTGVMYDDPMLSDHNLPSCWELMVNVTDTIGWSNASVLYCVYDTAPVSTVKNITPSTILSGTWPTLYVNVTDAELDNASVVNITWVVNGISSHMDSWSDVISGTILNSTYSGLALAGGDIINISIFANDSIMYSNITVSYLVGYSYPKNTSLVTGLCPTDIPSQMSLWLVVVICLFLIMAGILSAGFFAFFGGLGLLVVSWTLVGCSGLVGWIVALVGLCTMIWSVAVKDPLK